MNNENAGKPGFDSFGNPAPTTFGALGGQTLPPAVTLSERAGEDALLKNLSERFQWEDDAQLETFEDRF
jgi:hypothetical protein